MGKKFWLILIISLFYVSILINYPMSFIKQLGYSAVLNLYAGLIPANSRVNVIYNPGLRGLPENSATSLIRAVVPEDQRNFRQIMDVLLEEEWGAIVECSALDTWHTTPQGHSYLTLIRDRAYRVVVFDGGHHRPTLGLVPDIIIVPELNGYAVHSYMLDGIKLENIVAMAQEAGVPSIIAAIPRWLLVKNEKCLVKITQHIISSSPELSRTGPEPGSCKPRISQLNGYIFAYINQAYSNKEALFIDQVKSMDIPNLQKIYLAFDYRFTSQEAAELYRKAIAREFGIPVERVNDPVKVTNIFWGGKSVSFQ
jgi:hypothetical protein